MAWAHSLNASGHRHDLVAHLRGAAARARSFAEPFAAGELAYRAGLWHDLGKFSPAWQDYLLASERDFELRGHGPDHKGAGAAFSRQSGIDIAALLIQGHHGGLQSRPYLSNWLHEKASTPATLAALRLAQESLPELASLPLWTPPALRNPRSVEMYLRMVFSCLVDGDFLDTEAHFDPAQAAARPPDHTLAELRARFERDQARFDSGPRDVVSTVRSEVYHACLEAAVQPRGFYRLTVPTGGGKTRSGMAFALAHAEEHRLARVVVAIPFISITEQTADVYRGIFERPGEAPSVLEHHSSRMDDGTEEGAPGESWQRLASENWDAPIVVTTTVQLLESLFARSTSACRKLHNLARSVILVDEAQSLPPALLETILDGLRFLVEHCGTTVVFSTATQPAFETITSFRDVGAREIVLQAPSHFAELKRVEYEWRTDEPVAWSDLAAEVACVSQALVVVNTKKHAVGLVDALEARTSGICHLSTLLCGAHRRQVLAEVRKRLQEGEDCRLISTQVIEAGVDIDFPVVYRAVGPLDSIIQAAGRCNREGRQALGRVVVFRPIDDSMPSGTYRTATGVTQALLRSDGFDPATDETARDYFRSLYSLTDSDPKGIQEMRKNLDYPAVAEAFRMIEDDTVQVVVTGYGTDEERLRVRRMLDQLRAGYGSPRLILRQLQPFVVSLRRKVAERYHNEGLIAELMPGIGEWLGEYDDVRGLVVGDPEYVF